MKNQTHTLYPVDNAGQIFIPIHSPKETTLSRIAVTLKEPVDRNHLQKALGIIIKRFPYFQVYLKKKVLNYVFEHTNDIPLVEKDTEWTNRYIDFRKKAFLFRVKFSEFTIAVELSHILSDGYGTLTFLMSLLNQYFKLENKFIENIDLIKCPGEKIDEAEWKCGYRSTFSSKGPKLKMFAPAYIPKSKMIPVNKYYSTRIIMILENVQFLAKKMHVTLNVYMTAIYVYALQKMFIEDVKNNIAKPNIPIRMQIPVDLRKYYPSKTLKNFSYVYSPSFHSANTIYSFQEITKHISNHLRHERHTGYLEKQIARNLRLEKNIFFKFTPLFIKNLLFSFFYFLFSRNRFSGILTNLGNIKLPPSMENLIESFNILPGNSHFLGRISALYSYKGILEMNIGSSCEDLRLEKNIISILEELSIKHKVIYKRDNLK